MTEIEDTAWKNEAKWKKNLDERNKMGDDTTLNSIENKTCK